MKTVTKDKFSSKITNNKLYQFIFFILFTLLTLCALTLPISLRPAPYSLNIGDVAFQDVHAPRTFTYSSKILTEKARDEAEISIAPVYLPADTSISKEQIEKLSNILNYINSIRADEFADLDQKVDDLIEIEEIDTSNQQAEDILSLNDDSWQSIQDESLYILEEVMRNTIREDQVSYAQRSVLPLISFKLPDHEAELVEYFVSPLIAANSLFSNDKTNQAIQEARELVEPVTRTYLAGETIVTSGQIITPTIWEALQELGYVQPRNQLINYISTFCIVFVVLVIGVLYLTCARNVVWNDKPGLFILLITFLIFLYTAKLVIPNHTIIPYVFPIAAFALTISSLFDYEVAIISTIILAILVAFGQANAVDLSFFYILSSIPSIFVLRRGRRITNYFSAGITIGAIGSLQILAFRLTSSFFDLSGIFTLIGASFLNGLGSISLTLILQYFIALILGKITALQLMDLSRPDHPLLQYMLLNAPGTYQHCLQVANLAEQAAEKINADALLTRVGALYHDVGKANNPAYFIENQLPGQTNTHDDIDPVISAATIIQHVDDGLKLAKKYRLPPQIQNFISEHHGTAITHYQYRKAIDKAGKKTDVDRLLFQYPGPPPRSKETALLMLADGVEARTKAELPKNEDGIRNIVNSTVENYMKESQLENTDLTFKDINLIKESFIKTLINTYHSRIKYPKHKTSKLQPSSKE
ncbi:MAG TPA: HDIG domain-containing protein [Anaerolineae bacterium]|nr:HDIG domain-containing protein [Anaerolineae bacterium]